MKYIAMTASLQPHYLYSIFLPVPFGAYLFCSAKMNLVRVMQLVSIASMVAMVMLFEALDNKDLKMS